MGRRYIGMTVFDAAIDRMVKIYEDGHRVVISFSGGKDSGICVEICAIAAGLTGRLPIDVVMRDEEIMFPGTFEYCERMANRPEINFHWIYACQPVINVYNRALPYWWVFDPLVDPDIWVRRPPERAYKIPYYNIEAMCTPDHFPVDEGKDLYSVVGLRVSESRSRLMGLMSAGSYILKRDRFGVFGVRPVYDWADGDVWKAIRDNHWDYNEAYDVMARMGLSRTELRMAPPTMNHHGAKSLQLAAKAWPGWFERVCNRLDGVRLAAKYGRRAIIPVRRLNETWEACFYRTCIDDAPGWIAERARYYLDMKLRWHKRHSTDPFPEVDNCLQCDGKTRNWKSLTFALYNGDPFAIHIDKLPYVEPEYFRPGSGTWDGKPSF